MSNIQNKIQRTLKMQQLMVNSENSLAILKQIQAKTEELRSQKKQLQALSSASEGCLKGAGGDALRGKLAELITEQESIAKAVEEDAQKMQAVIRKFADADRQLAEQIRSKNSGR